ncbi:MAG: hypothetical protein JRJ39_15880 [Deltaproteobacteria bacterium]|nr:hypothetical protein [Deltaproteobacteria bacterium]MBW2182158.1 hypothetical protein [Deltaproteobacteria bacterium]
MDEPQDITNDLNPLSEKSTVDNKVSNQKQPGFDLGVEKDAGFHGEDKKASPNPSGRKTGNNIAQIKGPIGLDIGTANIVVAYNTSNDIKTHMQLNAFFMIPYSNITGKTLSNDGVLFFHKNDDLYILGDSAENFANMFGGNTRRPIEKGILNPKENESISVMKAIINKLITKPQKKNERICFSVPGDPIDEPASVVFHKSIIKRHLLNMGYVAESINEGLAVVLSELSGNNFTGIGISMGAGMCNICFSYLSVPVITYSVQKGGDYIDAMVGNSVNEPSTKIKVIKEEELDLSVEPRNLIETGLHIYYDDLFSTLSQSLQKVLGSSDNVPRLSKAIPIVLSGGTVLPRGVKKQFIKALKNIRLPVKISDIIIAEKPLNATAKGALVMAASEEVDM